MSYASLRESPAGAPLVGAPTSTDKRGDTTPLGAGCVSQLEKLSFVSWATQR